VPVRVAVAAKPVVAMIAGATRRARTDARTSTTGTGAGERGR
jgi:nicotinamide mononucleotide (NMN) deamidase PncC